MNPPDTPRDHDVTTPKHCARTPAVHAGYESTPTARSHVQVRQGRARAGHPHRARPRSPPTSSTPTPHGYGCTAPRTAGGPDEGPTAGSMSVADSGAAVRAACAHARSLFVAAAARRSVSTRRRRRAGRTVRPARRRDSVSYAELAPDVDLDVDTDATVPPHKAGETAMTGTSMPRVDLPDKLAGRPRFIQDLVLPGQLWGQVVRPPRRRRRWSTSRPGRRGAPGVVAVVRDGSFLGVVADDERRADLAAEALLAAAAWREPASLPDEDDLTTYLRDGPVTTFDADVSGDAGRRAAAGAAAVARPTPGPSSRTRRCRRAAAMARWSATGTDVHVWSHSQGVFGLRKRDRRRARTWTPDAVTVEHAEGAGAYGHNGADDAAFDAVLLARAVPGRPVHVRWRRADELSWAPFGSRDGGRRDGRPVDRRPADVAGSPTSGARATRRGPATPAHRACSRRRIWTSRATLPDPVDPPAERGGGGTRNAVPGYSSPVRRVRGHRRRPRHCGRRRCVRSAPSATCLRSSR